MGKATTGIRDRGPRVTVATEQLLNTVANLPSRCAPDFGVYPPLSGLIVKHDEWTPAASGVSTTAALCGAIHPLDYSVNVSGEHDEMSGILNSLIDCPRLGDPNFWYVCPKFTNNMENSTHVLE